MWSMAGGNQPNMKPLQDMQICHDPKKGLPDVRRFVGACNF